MVELLKKNEVVLRTDVPIVQSFSLSEDQTYLFFLRVDEYLEQSRQLEVGVQMQTLLLLLEYVDEPFPHVDFPLAVAQNRLPQLAEPLSIFVIENLGRMGLQVGDDDCSSQKVRLWVVEYFATDSIGFDFVSNNEDFAELRNLFWIDWYISQLAIGLLLEIDVGGKVGVEYFSSDGFLLVSYLKHLDIFVHGGYLVPKEYNKINIRPFSSRNFKRPPFSLMNCSKVRTFNVGTTIRDVLYKPIKVSQNSSLLQQFHC